MKNNTVEEVVEKLAMAITHSEQGEYAKNEAFVRENLTTLTQLHQELQKAVQEEKLKHCCCLIEDSKITERCKLHGDELQKARAEVWNKVYNYADRELDGEVWLHGSQIIRRAKEDGVIIDQSELDQPNNK